MEVQDTDTNISDAREEWITLDTIANLGTRSRYE